ncbi:MAG TPA: chorismate lyase [Candidatus Competibacteraceae bacterium]|nr:chorismate lyase [Candidatus Competibacteraceae bacterium]
MSPDSNRMLSPHRPEPRWRDHRQWRRAALPHTLVGWLLESGSMTRRLRQACGGDGFSVRVLGQYRARPLPSEARLLGLPARSQAWVREVQLLCHGQPWLFARTVIPLALLRGSWRGLKELGSRPLGEVLFADPRVHRGPLQLACIGAGQRLHRRAFGALPETVGPLWGRRSLFHIGGGPLLVCEILLPDLVRGCHGCRGS